MSISQTPHYSFNCILRIGWDNHQQSNGAKIVKQGQKPLGKYIVDFYHFLRTIKLE